jgi:hypothetical protein
MVTGGTWAPRSLRNRVSKDYRRVRAGCRWSSRIREAPHVTQFHQMHVVAVLLGGGVYLAAQSVSEAPAGFDGQSNGALAQSDMDAAAGVFSEVETPEKGLGPVFNGTSCAECHQNMAVGGGAQVQVLRAGHYSRGEHASDGYLHDLRRRSDTNGSSAAFTAASALNGGQPLTLAAKELQLLRYLIHHRDRVVPREEILQEVWEYDSQVSSRTIDVHVAWLRQKLDNPQNPKFIQTVRGKGYRFTPPA